MYAGQILGRAGRNPFTLVFLHFLTVPGKDHASFSAIHYARCRVEEAG